MDTAQLTGDASRRQHEIHASRSDRALRHGIVLRAFVLGESDPALGLDDFESQRSIGGAAGEDGHARALGNATGHHLVAELLEDLHVRAHEN